MPKTSTHLHAGLVILYIIGAGLFAFEANAGHLPEPENLFPRSSPIDGHDELNICPIPKQMVQDPEFIMNSKHGSLNNSLEPSDRLRKNAASISTRVIAAIAATSDTEGILSEIPPSNNNIESDGTRPLKLCPMRNMDFPGFTSIPRKVGLVSLNANALKIEQEK